MRHYLYLLIFSLLTFVSCETELPEGEWSKEPTTTVTYQLSVNKTSFVVKAEGASETFNITSDDSWTVSASEAWIKVSPAADAGNKTVTVTVEANAAKESRTGTITVKGKSSGTKSISVSQLGMEYSLTVDKSEISVSAAESSETFSITSNDDWTVSASEPWVKVLEATGNGNKTISVTIQANAEKAARTSTITITGKNSESKKTITLSQDGKDYTLGVDKSTISVGSTGSTETLTISCTDSWTATSDASWVVLSATSGSGDKAITVTVSLNSTSSSRTGTIIIKSADGEREMTVSVTQAGQEIIYSTSVSKTEISAGVSSASENFTISSNESWTASSDASWITLSATSGSGDKTITVSISSNSSATARSGKITVKGTTSGETRTIEVTQEGVSYTLTVSKSSITTDSAAGTESFYITTNDSWTASSDVSWATLSSTYGNGDESIRISISMNTSTTSRTGTITVSGANSGTTKTITITQAGQEIVYSTGVSKTSISAGADGASESFAISSNESWTATADASWVTLSATSGSGDKTVTVTVSTNSTTSARSAKITVKGSSSGETKSITVSQEGKKTGGSNGVNNGHEYVDLGLPSGLLWATCNVGASKPEDYGDYFAWGATSPQSVYDSVHTPYQTQNTTDLDKTKYTKYLGSTSSGYKDSSAKDSDALKTVLDLEDDAAHVNWGGSWRMPTRAEQKELGDNCTWTWTTQNGVNGYKATSKKNGNSLFLPAAGYRSDSSLNDAGSYGDYWTSSLDTSNPSSAYELVICSSYGDWFPTYRGSGLSVRPVCASSE